MTLMNLKAGTESNRRAIPCAYRVNHCDVVSPKKDETCRRIESDAARVGK